MKRRTIRSSKSLAITMLCTLAGGAPAADFITVPPDASAMDARKLVANACSKCHGPTGNGVSISPLFPILAAQQQTYLETQLKQLRQRSRGDPHARAFMWGIARALSDEQIEGVAQYFSMQPPAPTPPPLDANLAERGKAIYENPIQLESGEVNCQNCHGVHGEGKSKQAIPRLAGQHSDYMNLQIHYYRWELRKSAIMNQVSAALTEDQIAAVAEYVRTLAP